MTLEERSQGHALDDEAVAGPGKVQQNAEPNWHPELRRQRPLCYTHVFKFGSVADNLVRLALIDRKGQAVMRVIVLGYFLGHAPPSVFTRSCGESIGKHSFLTVSTGGI